MLFQPSKMIPETKPDSNKTKLIDILYMYVLQFSVVILLEMCLSDLVSVGDDVVRW